MGYRNIVFDIDGTLIDSERALLLSLQRTVREIQGRTLRFEDLRFIFGMAGVDALMKLGIKDVESASLIWNNNLAECSSGVQVFKGMEAILMELRARFLRLGIVTSKTRREYQKDFAPFGVGEYFDIVICAEDSIKHKPDPEPMEAYLTRSGVKADEVLFIGDSIYDMQCARGAGVDCGLALWGSGNTQAIEATYYLAAPGDILDILIEDAARDSHEPV